MKIGLVLAGGGSKGAYQIGVWKALIDLGIDKYVKVVSGTSIGALNAMLFLQGNYELAEEIWKNITKEKILPIDEKELMLKGILFFLGAKNMNFIKKYMPNVVKGGTLSREGLDEILEKIDFEAIKSSPIKGYAACTGIPEIKAEYFHINEHSTDNIKKILYATSAVPLVYDCQGIDNINYLDGAIVDNIPIQPVYGENCDIIIVVLLSADNKIDTTRYPNTNIVEINSGYNEGSDLKGMLDFDIDIIRKRITKGYKDTIYRIKPIMDIAREIDKNKIQLKSNDSVIEKVKALFK